MSERLLAYAWPGGYQMVYVCQDGGELCPECAEGFHDPEDEQWNVVDSFILEGTEENHGVVTCDHCNCVYDYEEGAFISP